MTVGRGVLRVLRTEPARPSWVRSRPRASAYALAAVCVGAFMGQLDASIVTVAVPTIQRGLHESVGAVVWVGLAYLLALVSTVAAVGRLSDVIGHKLVYLHGFVVFVVGSALCAVAPSLDWLIAFRVLQGLGAAMLQANSVAIIALAVPRERLARAIGVQGAAQALGLAAGPTLGGVLVALGGWRLLFLANVPAGIVAFTLAWFLLPRTAELRAGGRIDVAGLATFVPATAAVLCALTLGGDHVLGRDGVGALLGAAVLLGWWCWRHERRSDSPLIDPSVLAHHDVALGIAGAICSYVVLFGVLLVAPFFLERGLGLGVVSAGVVLAAMPVALAVTAPLAGRAAARLGSRRLTVGGMSLCAGGLVLLAIVHGTAIDVACTLAVVGVGLGLFTPANNAAVMAAAPRQCAGVASGLLNMGRGLGTALGLAITSVVLSAAAPSTGSPPQDVADALVVSAVVLAGVAVLAGVVSSVRPRLRVEAIAVAEGPGARAPAVVVIAPGVPAPIALVEPRLDHG